MTKRKTKIVPSIPYNIKGDQLIPVETATYLGVKITSTLSWKPHTDDVCRKATNVHHFLRRNMKRCSKVSKELDYKTLVRPILEYAATVWDPYHKEELNSLEMVQRRAARFVQSQHRSKR